MASIDSPGGGTPLPPATPPAATESLLAVHADPIAEPVPLREDQIQNAVSFLTHPKVRDSPAATKRSFLERKGLTAVEIDEAFRRAPSAPVTAGGVASPTAIASPVQGAPAGLITYQTQPQPQYAQPVLGSAQPGAIIPAQPPLPPAVQQQQQEPLRWTQVLLGVGALAAGVYAVRAVLLPRLTDWYSAWTDRAREQRTQQERQAAALLEAAEALKACQTQLSSTNEAMAGLVVALREQTLNSVAQPSPNALAVSHRVESRLEDAVALLKGLHQAQAAGAGGASAVSRVIHVGDERAPAWNGSLGRQPGTGAVSAGDPYYGVSPPPAYAYPRAGPPLGTGHAPGAASRTAPPVVVEPSGPPRPAPDQPPESGDVPYPQSFHEVLEMVTKGITPPNVRTDIQDTPPDPSRPLNLEGAPQPKPRPWERTPAVAGGMPLWGAPQPLRLDTNGASAPDGTMITQVLPDTEGATGGHSHGADVHSAHGYAGGAAATNGSSVLPGGAGGLSNTVSGGFGGGATPWRAGGGGGVASSSLGIGSWKPPPPPQPTLPRNRSTGSVASLASSTANGAPHGQGGSSSVAPPEGLPPAVPEDVHPSLE